MGDELPDTSDTGRWDNWHNRYFLILFGVRIQDVDLVLQIYTKHITYPVTFVWFDKRQNIREAPQLHSLCYLYWKTSFCSLQYDFALCSIS